MKKKSLRIRRAVSYDSMRDKVKDAIREYFDGPLYDEDLEVGNIADVVFDALGISEDQQDLTNYEIKVKGVKP